MSNQQSIYYLLIIFFLFNFCPLSYADMGSSSITPIQENISLKNFSKKEQRSLKLLKKQGYKPKKKRRNDGLFASILGIGLFLLSLLFFTASIFGSLAMFILGIITMALGLTLLVIGIVKAFKSTKQTG